MAQTPQQALRNLAIEGEEFIVAGAWLDQCGINTVEKLAWMGAEEIGVDLDRSRNFIVTEYQPLTPAHRALIFVNQLNNHLRDDGRIRFIVEGEVYINNRELANTFRSLLGWEPI